MASDTTDTDPPAVDADTDEDQAPNTVLNALIGAAVSVLLGFIPFSPLLGGGIAGYLEGGESQDGAKVGAISGLIAAIPLIVVIFLGLAVVAIAPQGGAESFFLLVLMIVFGVGMYTAALSTIGGVLGVYIKNEV